MTDIQQVDEDLVRKFRDRHVTPELEETGIYGLDEQYSSHPFEGRNTVELEEVYESLETTLSVATALEAQLSRGSLFENRSFNQGRDQEEFRTAYALYAGAKAGFEILDYGGVEAGFDVGMDEQVRAKGNEGLISSAINQYAKTLRDSTIRDETDVHQVTARYLDQVATECAEVMHDHPEHLDRVRDISLEVGDTLIEGVNGNDIQGIGIATDVTFDDVVGNEEFIKALRGGERAYRALSDEHDLGWEDLDADEQKVGILEKTLWYDPDEEANPFGAFPTSLLATGEPGTGKTLTLKAAARYAKERAREMDKPLVVNTVESGSVHSKYHGESAQNLEREFEKVTNPDTIGLLYIEDVESIFPARDVGTDNQEDMKTVNTLLNRMQGLKGDEDRGNYLIAMTTNYADKLDDAVKSRAQIQVEAQGPQEQEHFEEILPLLLTKNMPRGTEEKIKVDDWSEIAKTAEEYEFTGRDIDNITKNLAAEKSRMPNPAELQRADYDEQVELIKEATLPVKTDDLEEALEERKEHLEWQEEQKENRKKERLREQERLMQEVEDELENEED